MSRRWLLISAAWAAVALPMFGQSANATVPAFDAVSIKPHDPNAQMTRVQVSPDRYSAQNVSLKSMITYAYGLKTEDQVAGLSGPVASGRYDVEAKMDEETVAGLKKLSLQEANEKRQLILQAMLADRFKLKAHRESKRAFTVCAGDCQRRVQAQRCRSEQYVSERHQGTGWSHALRNDDDAG